MQIQDIFKQGNAGVLLDTPRADEEVRAIVHSHWFVLLREVVLIVIFFLLPFIALPFLAAFTANSGLPADKIGAASGLIAMLWALFMWQILFVRWTDYYYDVWIISNWRIIDFELQGLFHIDVATILDLDNIQDVRTKTDGILKNILGFGNVTLQTAGQQREFEFQEAANPREVERVIRAAQVESIKLNPIKPPV